ncbi:MAG: ABC transporter ATP-binding protein [Planctomycetota bacterium]
MTAPAIVVEQLSHVIEGQRVLEKVSFTVERGEFWSIVGRNGAGKTTLLKCLNRIYTGWSGRIQIDGDPLDILSQKELARRVSYVPQPGEALSPFTVREFALMSRYPHLSPFTSIQPRDEQAVEEALTITETKPFAARSLTTLSGGERQKVFIAAALAQGAPIMLLDEPTTFLDYRHQVEVLRLLRRINREASTTILAVTHDINTALRASDHVLALKNGRIVYLGSAQGVAGEATLARIYDVSFQFLIDPESGSAVVVPKEGGA